MLWITKESDLKMPLLIGYYVIQRNVNGSTFLMDECSMSVAECPTSYILTTQTYIETFKI